MSSLQIRPLSEHVGVEASGVDLNALDETGMASLRDAVANHGILFVRDQLCRAVTNPATGAPA